MRGRCPPRDGCAAQSTQFRQAPPVGADRPALFAKLDTAARLPLMLVVAGVGYGTTTLFTAWAWAAERRVAWVSLDPSDAELGQWAAHVHAALTLAGAQMPGLHVLFAGNRSVVPDTVAAVLADDLLDLQKPVALVLDDFHAAGGSAAGRFVDLVTRNNFTFTNCLQSECCYQ